MPIPKRFYDHEVEELVKYNGDFRRVYETPKTPCPTCDGTGVYTYRSQTFPCEDTPFGHLQMRAHKLYCRSFIPKEYQVLNWSEFPHTAACGDLTEYSDDWNSIRHNGRGVHIFGPLGLGKTWAACEILRRSAIYGSTGYFCQFKDVKSLHELLDPAERLYRTQRIRMSECLVMDEIVAPWGSQRQWDLFEDVLDEIIRYRAANNLPTITTTNLSFDELKEYYPRVHSLLRAKQIPIRLSGKDYRDTEAAIVNEQAAIKQLRERAPIYYRPEEV